MHYSLELLTVVVILLRIINGAKILAVHGTDLNSHFRVFSGFIEQIASHHNITFYMDNKFNYQGPKNVAVRYVDAPSRVEDIDMSKLFTDPCDIDSYNLFYNHILKVDQEYFESVFTNNNGRQLLNMNETFDLLIMAGYGAEHFYQLAHLYNVPIILVTPSQLMPWHNKAVNAPYSWINDFSFMVPDPTDTFFGRLKKFIKNAIINHRYYWGHMSAMNHVTKKYFPPDTPSIEEMMIKTDLIFVNTLNVQGYTRPNVPAVIEIGGLHIKPSKPLPVDLEEFVAGAGKHGFIYFSLGSLLQESAIKESVRKAILNVFRKLPQRILWKWKGEMSDVPPNVKLSKWFPQGDILAHKSLKLFITQGGMLSSQEAVYYGVPMLIFPVIFDQYNNGYLAEQRGYGKSMSFCHFTEKMFENYVNELLYNKTYSKNSKEMSNAMRHQNQNLKRNVNWWIDFVIDHKGTSMLRPLINYNSWTDMPFDLLSFFCLIFSCVICISLFSSLYVFKYILRFYRQNKIKSE